MAVMAEIPPSSTALSFKDRQRPNYRCQSPSVCRSAIPSHAERLDKIDIGTHIVQGHATIFKALRIEANLFREFRRARKVSLEHAT